MNDDQKTDEPTEAPCDHPEYYVDHAGGQWKEFFCAKCGAEISKASLYGRKNLGEAPRT